MADPKSPSNDAQDAPLSNDELDVVTGGANATFPPPAPGQTAPPSPPQNDQSSGSTNAPPSTNPGTPTTPGGTG